MYTTVFVHYAGDNTMVFFEVPLLKYQIQLKPICTLIWQHHISVFY